MADAIVTDVVQEVSRILTASDVVVEEFAIDIEEYGLTTADGTSEDISLHMRYHQCKADSSKGRLEEPQVDGDVHLRWSLSGGDDLKELVSTVLESTNVKAIDVFSDHRPYTHDVIEQFLQGLRTNHSIVSARFHLKSPWNTTIDVLDKSADMLCHNIGLKRFNLQLPPDTEGRKKHSGFGNALKMNHTLQYLHFDFCYSSIELDLDENGHQANSTLTTLDIRGL